MPNFHQECGCQIVRGHFPISLTARCSHLNNAGSDMQTSNHALRDGAVSLYALCSPHCWLGNRDCRNAGSLSQDHRAMPLASDLSPLNIYVLQKETYMLSKPLYWMISFPNPFNKEPTLELI